MDEAEIGTILVRLSAENEQYKAALKEAADATKRTEEAIVSVGNHIDGFGDQLSRWGELAVSALALHTLKDFLGESLGAWKETEDNAIKLNAILVANSRNVEVLTEDYNDFAGQIQRMTTTSDDATIALLSQAESFGLTGEAAKKAIKDAMGFAAMNGGNADSYLRFTAAMARGDTEMMQRFARMIPQLRGITDESELMRKAQLLAATGFQTAERQAGTLSGQLTQLSNAWGDLMESIGETTANALKPVVALVRSAVDFLNSFSAEAKQAATAVMITVAALASVGPAIATWRATIAPLMTMMDDGFRLAARAIITMLNPLNLVRGAIYGVRLAMLAVSKSIAFLTGWGAVLLAIGAVIGVVIDQLGGFAATWNYIKATALAAWDVIKETVSDFWQWFKPIGKAALGVLSAAWEAITEIVLAVWEVIKSTATSIWEFVTEIWTNLFGETVVNWEMIKDTIIDSLLAVEFAIRNFGDIARYVWLGIQLAAVKLVNSIIFHFTDEIPAALEWFLRNWHNILMDAWDDAKEIFSNLAVNVVEIHVKMIDMLSNINWRGAWEGFVQSHVDAIGLIVDQHKKIPDLISGAIDFHTDVGQAVIDFFKPAADEVENQTDNISELINNAWTAVPDATRRRRTEAFVLPQREEGELERQIREEFEAAGNALAENWEAFRARRRAEIAAEDQVTAEERPIPNVLAEDRKAAAKEIKDLQAVLVGSAEGLSRALKFREMVAGGPRVNTTSRMTPVSNNNAAAANTTEAVRRGNNFLQRIEQHLANMRRDGNNAPDINVADLNR